MHDPSGGRDVESLYAAIGFEAGHRTIGRRALDYTPHIEKRLRQFWRPHCGSIRGVIQPKFGGPP